MKTICSDETRRALLDDLRFFRTDAEWCRWAGVTKNIVSDAKIGKSMSVERENILRRALRLPEIQRTSVTIHHDERVVKRPGYGKPRFYAEFKVRVPKDIAPVIEAMIEDAEVESFSQLWHKQNPGYNTR